MPNPPMRTTELAEWLYTNAREDFDAGEMARVRARAEEIAEEARCDYVGSPAAGRAIAEAYRSRQRR